MANKETNYNVFIYTPKGLQQFYGLSRAEVKDLANAYLQKATIVTKATEYVFKEATSFRVFKTEMHPAEFKDFVSAAIQVNKMSTLREVAEDVTKEFIKKVVKDGETVEVDAEKHLQEKIFNPKPKPKPTAVRLDVKDKIRPMKSDSTLEFVNAATELLRERNLKAEMERRPIQYAIYIYAQKFHQTAYDLSEDDVLVLSEAYAKGKDICFIRGEKFHLKNLDKIRVYEHKLTLAEIDTKLKDEWRTDKVNMGDNQFNDRRNYFTDKGYKEFAKDVTTKYMIGNFGEGKRVTPTDKFTISDAQSERIAEMLGQKNEVVFAESATATPKQKSKPKPETIKPMSNDKVFIVHGHDVAMKESVARFVERLGLTAIILHERDDEGLTVIEKLEKNADVAFAVVLLSPDDTCGIGEHQTKRARQNVIFEFGYFVGKLSRKNVVMLYKETVEIPSDLKGLLYVPYDLTDSWHLKVARALNSAGLDVDMNKLIK